jgi:hypothetical protein
MNFLIVYLLLILVLYLFSAAFLFIFDFFTVITFNTLMHWVLLNYCLDWDLFYLKCIESSYKYFEHFFVNYTSIRNAELWLSISMLASLQYSSQDHHLINSHCFGKQFVVCDNRFVWLSFTSHQFLIRFAYFFNYY